MNRYEELEKLYYKRIILKYTIFISLIILFITGFFILKNKTEKKEIKHKITVKKIQKKEIKIVKITKKVKQKSDINKTVKIYHFILPKTIAASQNRTKISKNKKNYEKKQIKEIQINHTANLDKIKITEKTTDLKTLINKFNITKDFDLAILISKIYFQKNNLTDAQIWALRANTINPASYKSWILFADILLKKKESKKAKEILKVYINSYGQNDIIEKKLRSLYDE